MKVPRSLLNTARKALAESIDFRTMIHLARELIPDYDIYKIKGITENISITRREAAEQIINDMYEKNLILQFLNILLGIQFRGIMGRKYKISQINELINALSNIGFTYDMSTCMLMEHPKYRVSRNWGTLIEDEDYFFSFMWLDIVGHSRMVKKYKKEDVEKTYKDFFALARKIIEGKNGRIWIMDGDGLLGAYHFLDKSQMSVLSSIKILHELNTYNILHNRLDSPLKVKISVHNGKCVYSDDNEKTKKCETIQQTINLIKAAEKPDVVVISSNTESMLDPVLSNSFFPEKNSLLPDYYTYSFEWMN